MCLFDAVDCSSEADCLPGTCAVKSLKDCTVCCKVNECFPNGR